MTGKEIRLNKLFKHSGRLFTVPMDHGITLGPIKGLDKMFQLVGAVSEGGADAVIVHKGIVKEISSALNPENCELIIHLSASTSLAPDGNQKELVSSVEHAIRLGATAISVHVNLASNTEATMLKDFGRVAEECELWGMPLLAMVYVRDGTKESDYDPEKIKHAARIAQEIGADIVKVNYSGSPESFSRITESVSIPVIIAGGPKQNSTYNLLEMIFDAVQAGAKGVSIGRNVFQDNNPKFICSAIRQVLDGKIPQDKIKELADSLGS